MSVLVFKGPCMQRVWGSTYFKDVLHITDDPVIGELWSLSGYSGKASIVTNGIYKDMTLDELFIKHPEIFNNKTESKFPILIKLIATSSPLSVQVHPNDEYAAKYENSFGKTEGWLILSTSIDSTIVLGHNAKSKEELNKMIDNHEFKELLKEIKVNNGEFYPIPSGTVHALGKDIVLVEVQQSSDITYRLYDYDRLGLDGKPRELHLDKAKDVISLDEYKENIINIFESNNDLIWDAGYFKVYKKEIKEDTLISASDTYVIGTVAQGEIEIDNIKLSIGESFIIPYKEEETIKGNGLVIITKSNI